MKNVHPWQEEFDDAAKNCRISVEALEPLAKNFEALLAEMPADIDASSQIAVITATLESLLRKYREAEAILFHHEARKAS